MEARVFRDRTDAGDVLARRLESYRGADTVVLALPRGGVPVAFQVAEALSAPLDVVVVRKLGAPKFPELAVGAIAGGGVLITNDDTIRAFDIDPETLEEIAEAQWRELHRRETAYRGDRPPADVTNKTVIVVDDGLATGSTMLAALTAIRAQSPARVVVAVPVAPADTCEELSHIADDVICAVTPKPFTAVGSWYWDFDQTSDEEVARLLATPTTRPAQAAPRRPDDVDAVRRRHLRAPAGIPADDQLFDLVGDARFVLIGEASHGTHEFYAARAHMTRRLIEEKGFHAVAVEADWPDAYRVNRFVHGTSSDADANEALRGFQRFPQWMWRNTVVEEFVDWLRHHNRTRRARVGFYGLDLYSMQRSIGEVINYLDQRDPSAARRARDRYSCFEHFADEQRYGRAAAFGAGESCEDEVLQQLIELQHLDLDAARRDSISEDDERFYANQNARLVKAAEEYYRSMFAGHIATWNLRDRHMAQTLTALADHLEPRHGTARIVVWAHNSHLGDARATELAEAGELNLGQLVRETYPGQCRSIGFTTYSGTVTAADNWGGQARTMRVQPALPGSIETLLHSSDCGDFSLRGAALPALPLLQRAIGVIYRPQTERQSHYFLARLADQFDAVIHVDHTTALQPLPTVRTPAGQEPDTYPFAV